MTQSSKGPLSGIVVVDLSRILAGPYCTLLMAEMGARVIKVEPPKGGDDARAYGPFVKGKSTYFASVNRGKESIALDLKNDEQRKVFEKLLEKADVIVENFRPGTMEKLGYGWDTLHKKYPKLIYASASGFGHTGPNSKDPAYDMVVQGMGGVMSITGNEGQPPARVGMSIGDIGAGLFTAVAVNAALLHRLKTGESTKVDIGMFDCQIALLENAVNFPEPDICSVWGVRDLGAAFRSPVKSPLPALFISGTLDVNAPMHRTEEIRRGFPNSSHLIVENGGHEDLFIDSPKQIEAMVAFLKDGLYTTTTITLPGFEFLSKK